MGKNTKHPVYDVSQHSIARQGKRFHSHGGARCKAQIQEAILLGRKVEDFSGKEREWMERKIRPGYDYYAYKGKFVVIDSQTLTAVTVYRLPGWFNSSLVYDGKVLIRNLRTYIRNYEIGTEIIA